MDVARSGGWPLRITTVFLRRRERVLLVLLGSAVGVVLNATVGMNSATLSWVLAPAMVAAAPLGVVKAATACGLNSLGSFTAPGRERPARLTDWTIYAVTSTLSGAALGAALGLAGQFIPISLNQVVALFLIYLGLRELGIARATPPLASRWQVPARWLGNPRRAAVVWGLWLGPGIATQMPHPMFYGLLSLALILPLPAGPALLGFYGACRAFPALVAAIEGAAFERQFRSRAYEIRLAGHAVCGALAIAIGVSMVSLHS